MPTLRVYWRMPELDQEEQRRMEEKRPHTGVLTTEHEAASNEVPVLVEDLSRRVYRPDELPSETVLFIEAPPAQWPPLAEHARRVGFRVAHTEEGEVEAALPEDRVDKDNITPEQKPGTQR